MNKQQFDQKPERMLILDFDGVVVDTEELHYDSWRAAFAEFVGHSIGRNGRSMVGLTLNEIYAYWCHAAAYTHPLTAAQKQALLARKTELFYELGTNRLQPMPGVLDLAQQAIDAGWYVTIASRSRRKRLLKTLAMINMPATFDLLLGSEDCVDPATDRKVHSRAAAPFGIAPAACLLIEDSKSGVRDGRACGIGHIVGLTTAHDRATLYSAGADTVVDCLTQVSL